MGPIIVVVLALCIVINLKSNNGTLQDLSLNIIAETIGIAITIFVIDRLIKRGEWKRQFFFDKQTRFKYIFVIQEGESDGLFIHLRRITNHIFRF